MPSDPVVPPLGGDFSLGRLGQVSIRARDLSRAVAFYRDRLGLPLQFSAENLAFFDAQGVRLMLALPGRSEFDHPGSVLYFVVADVRRAYQALVERGVRFTGSPHRIAQLETGDLWMAFFHDTEGNMLAIMNEVPLPPSR